MWFAPWMPTMKPVNQVEEIPTRDLTIAEYHHDQAHQLQHRHMPRRMHWRFYIWLRLRVLCHQHGPAGVLPVL